MQTLFFRTPKLIFLLSLIGLLTACNNAPTTPAATVEVLEIQPTSTVPEPTNIELTPASPTATLELENPQPVLPTPTQAAVDSTISSPTPRATPGEDDWTTLPVIPSISQTTREIYQVGIDLGRDPQAFSKIGDCQNVSAYFLSPFAHTSAYRLGPFAHLQQTIDWYQQTGSFTRDSLAVKGGFNVAAVLSPLRADPDSCQSGESPLACELRVHNPSVAIISMETWWSGQPDAYEKYMRQLLDYTINQGVVPILATKADNLEGENQINKALAQLAWEYDIPLWNFWASVQELPGKGLTQDGFHLTLGNYFYDDPVSTATGWSMRNLTALMALDAVRQGITP